MVGRLVASLCVSQTHSMILKKSDVSQNLLSMRLGSEPILRKFSVWTYIYVYIISNLYIKMFL